MQLYAPESSADAGATMPGMARPAHDPAHRHDDAYADPLCAMAHGDLPPELDDRRLVAVFDSPVARYLLDIGRHCGFRTVLVEPTPDRVDAALRAHWPHEVSEGVPGAGLDPSTDVVVTDHDRPELGDLLAEALASQTRWVGVMGSLRHTAPHVAALQERGVAAADIARVHRPIGLDIGSHAPAEIAVATIAGLLADRNGRAGGLGDRSAAGTSPR